MPKRRDGDPDVIVLAETEDLALLLPGPDDEEIVRADLEPAADRVDALEELLGDVRADDADVARMVFVLALDVAPGVELDDRSDEVVEGRHAPDLGLLDGLVPVLDGPRRARAGPDELAGPAGRPEEAHLVQGDVPPLHLLLELLERRPDHRELGDREVVGPVEGHLRVDVVVEALDDGDDGDDGQHPDDDAEERQERPELVGAEGDHGHRERFPDLQFRHIVIPSYPSLEYTAGTGFGSRFPAALTLGERPATMEGVPMSVGRSGNPEGGRP